MDLTKAEVIEKVRLAINEISDNDSDFDSGSDEAELETIIADKAIEALRFVHGNADIGLLEPDAYAYMTDEETTDYEYNEDTTVGSYTVGTFILPNTFMRLVYAGYYSWPGMVSDPVLPTDKEWASLFNAYTTGTAERPRVGLRKYYEGSSASDRKKAVVLLFSKASSETGGVAAYMINYTDWQNDGTNDYLVVSQLLEDAFIYYLSGLVLTTLGDERQQNMYEQAALMMGISKATEPN